MPYLPWFSGPSTILHLIAGYPKTSVLALAGAFIGTMIQFFVM